MRTTLTLDDDVCAKLQSEARRTGATFKTVVNEAIRRGLLPTTSTNSAAFVVRSEPLGLRAGLSYENLEDVLDDAEGADRR